MGKLRRRGGLEARADAALAGDDRGDALSLAARSSRGSSLDYTRTRLFPLRLEHESEDTGADQAEEPHPELHGFCSSLMFFACFRRSCVAPRSLGSVVELWDVERP